MNNNSWPDCLIKSTEDPFLYAIGWRGKVIVYESARGSSDGIWVTLNNVKITPPIIIGGVEATFCRGVEIRVSEIEWISDAGGFDS